MARGKENLNSPQSKENIKPKKSYVDDSKNRSKNTDQFKKKYSNSK